MPNRILRDYTDSAAFDGLSAEAERLFIRLLTKADDFGRFHANPKLVKSACFPLAEDLRANTVAAWLTELSDRQLVFCYTSGTGQYLSIAKFGQRTRAENSRFPAPDGKPPDWLNIPPSDVSIMRADDRSPPSSAPVFGDGDGGEKKSSLPRARGGGWPELQEVVAEAERVMALPVCAEAFFNEMEACGWVNKHGQPIHDWRPLLRNYATRWKANDHRNNGSARPPPRPSTPARPYTEPLKEL